MNRCGALAAACVAVLLVAGAGCGRKGPVKPPEFVVPKTISDVTAANEAEGVALAWRRPVEYADGSRMDDLGRFVIERAEAGGGFATLVTLDVSDRDRFRKLARFRYVDRTAAAGVAYRYRVVAVTVDHYVGAPSNAVEISRVRPVVTPGPGTAP